MIDQFPYKISFKAWIDAVDIDDFEHEDIISAVESRSNRGDFEAWKQGNFISIRRRGQPEATLLIVSPAAEAAFIREINGLPIEDETERGLREGLSNSKA